MLFSYRDICVNRLYFNRLVELIFMPGHQLRTAGQPSDRVIYTNVTNGAPDVPSQHMTTAQQFAQWVRRKMQQEHGRRQ